MIKLLPLTLSALSIQLITSFQIHRHRQASSNINIHTLTILYEEKKHHQFNGGYDASSLVSAKWTPLEAVEFVIWHVGDNYADMGRQLTPLIQNWSGKDWGEFLTRLYLGETNDNFEVSFESRNVQNPQWKGLKTEKGLSALKDLLSAAIPSKILEDPIEVARLAEVFLWKEHTWPATNATAAGELEVASLASLGHTTALVNIWKALSDERGSTWKSNRSIDEVLAMIPNPRKEWGSVQLHGMQEFFTHMEIQLTSSEKVELVQGMAHGGWPPAKIAKFVSTFPEIPERAKPQDMPPITKAFYSPVIPEREKPQDEPQEEPQDKLPTKEFYSSPPTTAALRINKAPTIASALASALSNGNIKP